MKVSYKQSTKNQLHLVVYCVHSEFCSQKGNTEDTHNTPPYPPATRKRFPFFFQTLMFVLLSECISLKKSPALLSLIQVTTYLSDSEPLYAYSRCSLSNHQCPAVQFSLQHHPFPATGTQSSL